MRSSAARWVGGEDFFGCDREVQVLETWVHERNHVPLKR